MDPTHLAAHLTGGSLYRGIIFGIDVQAGHVAYTISELGSRGSKAANVSVEAEERWIADQLETRGSGFVLGGSPDSCTPGYYNREGQGSTSMQNSPYAPGINAFNALLAAWRGS